MNVKIANKQLRFKISDAELLELLAGDFVQTRVVMVNKTLKATIDPRGHGETMEPMVLADDNENELCVTLVVSPANIKALADLGADRDGIRQDINGTSVTLQVDMKDACHK